MLEEVKRKEVDKRDKQLPQSFEQLIQMYDLEHIWTYIGNMTNYINNIYPIGSIYISTNDVSPATIFGGTWEQIKDRFLLACGDNYSNGANGGEATHTLTIDEMPKHKHTLNQNNPGTSNLETVAYTESLTIASVRGDPVNETGGDQPHNNMPPYLAVYIWKRIS